MDVALGIGFWIAATVYGGALFAFAILLNARRLVADGGAEHVVRVWWAWGPGQGLSLGLLILLGAVRYYLEVGGFSWPLETQPQQLTAAAHVVFLVMWGSSFHAEIWTLEPCRKLDHQGAVTDRPAYEAAAGAVARQVTFNALLFCAVGILLLLA